MTAGRVDDRALLDAFATGEPRAAAERLARVLDPDGASLARRDAALLELHVDRYGPQLACVGACPDCGEELELQVDADLLRPPTDAEAGLEVDAAGYALAFRLPTAEDVRLARGERDLAERCVTAAWRSADGADVAAASLPEEAIAAMAERMGSLHPAADVRLALDCPACGCAWEERLDMVAFVTARARAESLRIVGDVHALASAYGWSEEQVLALPSTRRRDYLELVHG